MWITKGVMGVKLVTMMEWGWTPEVCMWLDYGWTASLLFSSLLFCFLFFSSLFSSSLIFSFLFFSFLLFSSFLFSCLLYLSYNALLLTIVVCFINLFSVLPCGPLHHTVPVWIMPVFNACHPNVFIKSHSNSLCPFFSACFSRSPLPFRDAMKWCKRLQPHHGHEALRPNRNICSYHPGDCSASHIWCQYVLLDGL